MVQKSVGFSLTKKTRKKLGIEVEYEKYIRRAS